MTENRKVDVSRLPSHATSGGYLYVISFDNGTVKVGSTINPSRRVRTHQMSAAQFGITILDLWVSPEIDGYIRAEKRLISAASLMSTGVALREWFHGVDFHTLVRSAQQVTSPGTAGDSADGISTPGRVGSPTAPLSPRDLWLRAREALDVDTNAEAAVRCGVSLRTMERLFANPGNSLIRNVLAVRDATGITLEDFYNRHCVVMGEAV